MRAATPVSNRTASFALFSLLKENIIGEGLGNSAIFLRRCKSGDGYAYTGTVVLREISQKTDRVPKGPECGVNLGYASLRRLDKVTPVSDMVSSH